MSYNLEEQEQLAQLRYFWSRWGNHISMAALVVALGFAGYFGWQWWQRSRASDAAVAFEQVQAAIQSNNAERIKQAWAAMQAKAPSSAYAGMAALATAKALHDAGQNDAAISALQWAAKNAEGNSERAVARLNLSALQIDAKQYAEAASTLADNPEPSFAPLFDFRRGDLAALQGQRAAARKAYDAALKALPPGAPERQALQQRLQAVGGAAA